MTWKYHLYRANGDGTETRLYHSALPLSDVKFTDALSGPGGIRASIKPEQLGMVDSNGDTLFVPWSTVLYAEQDGRIYGGILTDPVDEGPKLALDFIGFSGYANGQPYTADNQWVDVDPLNIVRHIWTHLQTKPRGNLGMIVSGDTSPMRVGKPLVDGNASKEEGPFVLGWWETHDVGKVIDDLATETPFDYVVKHEWVDETGPPRHFLQLGYPTIGRRLDERFVVGENIFTTPQISYQGEEYADEVLLLGAGEGRKMVRGLQQRQVNRLRRAVVVEDKTKTSQAAAERAALDELSYRLGDADIQSVTITDHPNAPTGSYSVGDEFLLTTRKGWHDGLSMWLRILEIETTAETNETTVTVVRSDKGNH